MNMGIDQDIKSKISEVLRRPRRFVIEDAKRLQRKFIETVAVEAIPIWTWVRPIDSIYKGA